MSDVWLVPKRQRVHAVRGHGVMCGQVVGQPLDRTDDWTEVTCQSCIRDRHRLDRPEADLPPDVRRAEVLREAAALVRDQAQYERVRGQRVVEMCARVLDRAAEKAARP